MSKSYADYAYNPERKEVTIGYDDESVEKFPVAGPAEAEQWRKKILREWARQGFPHVK